jgi:hypothetical protein
LEKENEMDENESNLVLTPATANLLRHLDGRENTPNPEQVDDVLSSAELREKVDSAIVNLSKKRGRFWSLFGEMPIGTSVENFFRCHLRGNEVMDQKRQREEMSQDRHAILCWGCPRSSGMTRRRPQCVGHLILTAWRSEHPEIKRYD